ncbi:caspase domain-containing protein [Streptomyces sp. G-5]|uniref:caspase family protein n=1 Tax=Streptomyces sp. G-5 TaxID=2977231 RepID=UPI0021D2F489|nr:caspase family protein [Streptomyces sp. G-5]MCU4749908.1 caspase family protein [Streptomyces sp. G-5]
MSVRAVDPGRSRVVLVGVPTYDDPELPDVPVVANNIFDLHRVLTHPGLGGFDPVHCAVVPPTAGLAEVGTLVGQAAADAEDLLLFYYSGHGLLSVRRRELYLALSSTRREQLPFTALPFDAVREVFLDSRAAIKAVILDSCFSGRAIGETLADDDAAVLGQLEVAGTYIMTAAPANRTALILPGEKHTAFTERLLRVMRSGIAGAGHVISLGDIYRHLHFQLRAEGLPSPQQNGTETADQLGILQNQHAERVSGQSRGRSDAESSEAAAVRSETSQGSGADFHDDAPVPDLAAARAVRAEQDERDAHFQRQQIAQAKGRARLLLTQGEVVSRHLSDNGKRIQWMARLAVAMMPIDEDLGVRLAREAERQADAFCSKMGRNSHSIPKCIAQVQPLAEVAVALATVDPQRARALAQLAVSLLKKATSFPHYPEELSATLRALVAVAPDQAETLIQEIDKSEIDKSYQDKLLLEVAELMAPTHPERALRIARDLPERKQPHGDFRLSRIANAMAPKKPDYAEAVAHSIKNPEYRDRALKYLVSELAKISPGRAEKVAHCITDKSVRQAALGAVFYELLRADPKNAERFARTAAIKKSMRDRWLAEVAESMVLVDPDSALQIIRNIHNETTRGEFLYSIFERLRDLNPQLSQQVARAIPKNMHIERALAKSSTAEDLAATNPEHTQKLIEEAQELLEGIGRPKDRALALLALAQNLASHAPRQKELLVTECERFARETLKPEPLMRILSGIIAINLSNDPQEAARIAMTALHIQSDYPLDDLARFAFDLATHKPATAKQIAIHIIHTARQENEGDRENLHSRDALVALSLIDPSEAVRLATMTQERKDTNLKTNIKIERLIKEIKHEAYREIEKADRLASESQLKHYRKHRQEWL